MTPTAPPSPTAAVPLDSAPLDAAHALAADDVTAGLGVSLERGLTADEALARLAIEGPNELSPPPRVSVLGKVLATIMEPFIVLLAVAGGLALVLGEVRDGILVLVGLLPIVVADVATQYRSERALAELREAAAPRATVRRDGASLEVPARELVVGDIVVLRAGDVVPADLRILRVDALTLDRSVLTGESLPEEASTAPDDHAAALADRRSIAYAGTAVVLGRGEGVVVATGERTEIGRIAGGLGPTDRGRSPLQRELDRLVRILLTVAVGLIVLTVSSALLRGATYGEALLAGVSAAIAAIPEEPPVLLAVILGLGAYRLLRRGVLVRRLSAQEALGGIDLIITDKTGTLTENRLALVGLVDLDGSVDDPVRRQDLLTEALRAEDDAWEALRSGRQGSFTRAIAGAHGETALPQLERDELLAASPPRDGRPYSMTRVRRDGSVRELAIGAPEAVLGLADGGSRLDAWRVAIEQTASDGRRLLLLAGRDDGSPWAPLAILAFSDTLRPGVPGALRMAAEAGIQTIVVTGDHPMTTAAIAREAGLGAAAVATGTDLDELSDDDLAGALRSLHIVARATPDQKLRLVEAARASGRSVAVTGDGVNDAPALQRADVGVAMGSGTAVAREAADLVLGDDSFVTLMNGLSEGRRIVANVGKGLVFLTSTHVALLGFILLATLAGYVQPLLPIQILWLELFIDLSTSVAFEREPPEPDIMRRPPRPRTLPILTRSLLLRIAVAGGFTATAALVLMSTQDQSLDEARWLAFNALVFGQMVRAYANRTLDRPVWRLPRNGFLLGAIIAASLVQLAIPYVPLLASVFRASPLDGVEFALIAVIAIAPALVAETVRTVRHSTWVA